MGGDGTASSPPTGGIIMNGDEFYDFDDDEVNHHDLHPTEARKRAEEMLKRIINDGRLPEMLFRAQFMAEVVKGVKQLLGNDGILELLCAIDNESNWHTEIIAERADVENIMLQKYGAFDDDMWEKIKETIAWTEFHRDIFEASKVWLEKAVDEVINQH